MWGNVRLCSLHPVCTWRWRWFHSPWLFCCLLCLSDTFNLFNTRGLELRLAECLLVRSIYVPAGGRRVLRRKPISGASLPRSGLPRCSTKREVFFDNFGAHVFRGQKWNDSVIAPESSFVWHSQIKCALINFCFSHRFQTVIGLPF